jgi:hypothetical protein
MSTDCCDLVPLLKRPFMALRMEVFVGLSGIGGRGREGQRFCALSEVTGRVVHRTGLLYARRTALTGNAGYTGRGKAYRLRGRSK